VAGLVGLLAPGDLERGRAVEAGIVTGPRKRRAGPLLPGSHDTARECRGCGVVAELVQGSDWCWDCTYDPTCLCVGAGWRRSADSDFGEPHDN
jgi:hypothetical protein